MVPKINIIAAIQKKDRAIGYQGRLLWNIPEDLKHFKTLTTGHPIIMGKKTFESIGRPLPNRTNIVLTYNPHEQNEGCIMCTSLEDALRIAEEHDPNEIFIIGGGEVYRQTLPYANVLYLTLVEGDYEADTFFPEYGEFSEVKVLGEGQHEGLRYMFLELTKPTID